MNEAICIGINHFKNFPSNSLSGCVNDAENMKKFFLSEIGGEAVVTLLLEDKATKEKIVKAIKTALARADRVYISISSHGSQVSDGSGDETDGWDECIICHDTTSRFANVITDDELNALFANYPRKHIECWFDLCHSGTGLRFFPFRATRRFLPNPHFLGRGIRKENQQPSNAILWAGCRPDEYSYDTEMNGAPCGAFTHFFLKSYSGKLSRRKINDRMLKAIVKDYDQHPQLECSDLQRNGCIFK
jgi:metacaspase-1